MHILLNSCTVGKSIKIAATVSCRDLRVSIYNNKKVKLETFESA